MLQDDGVELVKIFLAISKDEQLKRFEDRLRDPYKQWKLTKDDMRSRKKWDDYVEAVDQMFMKTNTRSSKWIVIPANQKPFARREVLRTVTSALHLCQAWMEKQASKFGKRSLAEALKELGKGEG